MDEESMYHILIRLLKKIKLYRDWKKKNRHNETLAVSEFDYECIDIGNYSYGAIQVLNYNKTEKLKIGSFCSIGPGVVFVLNADHRLDTISTFPFKVKCLKCEEFEAVSKGNIIVDDDVWIGQNAIILSGVHIGQGAVIAAGAVVTKDVLPYAIVGGNPAKVIKYRFSSELINELLKVDYGKLTKELVEAHINELYEKLEKVEQLAWMPKKKDY